MMPRRMSNMLEAVKELPISIPIRRSLACVAILGATTAAIAACGDENSFATEPSVSHVTTSPGYEKPATPTSTASSPSSSEVISVIPSQGNTTLPSSEEALARQPLVLYYGDACEAIVDKQIANTITMDYVNSKVDVYTGERSDSTKDGVYQRVEAALQQDYSKFHIKLTKEQTDILKKSISHLVDESLGENPPMNGGKYAITVASFANDFAPQVVAEKTDDMVDGEPVYTVPNMNHCVYNLVKTD